MSTLDVPAEWWERALAGWRGWWARHAGFARGLVRVQQVVSTVALVLGVVALVVVPRLAIGLVPALFMTGCLLVVGLLARTRTLGLRPLLLLMGISAPWSLLIAHATLVIGEAIGLSTADDGARIALAAFVEEPGKLLPLLALALLAPGRVRRLAAVDWALLGFATGAGFTIAEDGARRLVPPGLIAELLGEDRLQYSLNPWTAGRFLIHGGSWAENLLELDTPVEVVATGHQVPTMGVAMGIALGLALWRTAKPWWRAVAWLPPVVMLTMAIVDHACYNATVGWTGWADQDTAIPTWIRLAWHVRGQGRTQIAVSVVLFIACMLVDARRRHRAGVFGDVVIEAPKAPALPMTGVPLALRAPVQAVVWLAAYTWSDLAIIAAAYGDRTLSRRARMAEGRAMGVQVRGVRQDAMTVTTPGTEPAARNAFRLVALTVGAVMLAVCLWYGTALAQDIGSWLQQPDWPYFFAGLLDGLAQWWDSLGVLGQILVTALAVLLLAWAGLSVAAALGAVGVGTWVLSHGRGIATFLQDPAAATRSYAANATWEQLLLDGADFALTFIPGSALGLGTRKAARTAAESVAVSRAARREIAGLTEVNNLFAQRDAAKAVRVWTEQQVTDWVSGLHTVVRRPYNSAIQYQHRVLGTNVEHVIPTGVPGETIVADAVTKEGNIAVAWEAKYTEGGANSLYEGGRPDFLYKKLDDEIKRYGRVISNPDNPVRGLTIITNTEKAAEFLSSRIRSILGEDFPLTIKVAP
ncbi:restriction endonuclease fold toxin-2 domain-containing protein [Actinomyces sp. 432]|uniref:restriction endonuclease fold toxin-2 domain-containing protein n=1 Tax=Actinomyces sp. 432 TaxID=2057798 RepID=UPI001379A410|nr:restriction endonuclease fold toxin-2 domain-containing protein [Actinomyces sp. 432]